MPRSRNERRAARSKYLSKLPELALSGALRSTRSSAMRLRKQRLVAGLP